MRIIVENHKHEEIPTHEVKCDNCESILEITQNDLKSERRRVYWSLLKQDVEYFICPVCGNKMYRVPANFWTRTCHLSDYGE